VYRLPKVSLVPLKKKNEAFISLLHQQEIGSTWIKSEQDQVYEIQLGKQCVGLVMLSMIAPEANLINLAVEKPLQNMGIGKQALQLLIKKLTRSKVSMLHLEVREQSPALRFYLRQGFYSTGLRKAYYADGEHAILMTKQI